MRQILANLPAVGAFKINLHNESKALLDFFGEDEVKRLGRIDHLGAATLAFPGINHSRQEYVLLQCAIAQIVGKLYKDNSDLALSSCVEIADLDGSVSSGEELLKCWAFLGNIGHPNWTFSTLKALLGAADSDNALRDWLLCGAVESDLMQWGQEILETADYRNARWLITLLRLRVERPHDNRKFLFRQVVRSRLINSLNLDFSSGAAREKVVRLRVLSRNIQFLSMVILDAYYSHSPLRVELLPAIQELAESAARTRRRKRFLDVLTGTAGWLADEVYLHPQAIAVQRDYESRGIRTALRRFRRIEFDADRSRQYLRDMMRDGFGEPRIVLKPLVRLSLGKFDTGLFGAGNRKSLVERLNSEIAVRRATLVSVEENTFLKRSHLDILGRDGVLTGKAIGQTYFHLSKWLLRTIEARALERTRRNLPVPGPERRNIDAMRERLLMNSLMRAEPLLETILLSLVGNIIPKDHSASLEEVRTHQFAPRVGWWFHDSKGNFIDQLTPRLDKLYAGLQGAGETSRVHELSALRDTVARMKKSFVAVFFRPVVVRDALERKIDEWDGLLLELTEESLRVIITEAKGGGGRARRADEAFAQLGTTRSLLRQRYSFETHRTRIRGKGAFLSLTLFDNNKLRTVR